MLIKWLIVFLFPFCCYGESFSFYNGYLFYKQYLAEIDLDFDQVVEGMKAAHRGVEISEEELKKKKAEFLEIDKEENLNSSKRFLSEIAKQEGIQELVPGKLYYKIVQQGQGAPIQESDSPTLFFLAKTLVKGKEADVYRMEEAHPILLKNCIPGFAQGVVGMQEKEKRILYIHPELAYGVNSRKLGPNSLMIFEVEVVVY
jgi:FKBP-type peptidyl-prolyl cis-trans isomerase